MIYDIDDAIAHLEAQIAEVQGSLEATLTEGEDPDLGTINPLRDQLAFLKKQLEIMELESQKQLMVASERGGLLTQLEDAKDELQATLTGADDPDITRITALAARIRFLEDRLSDLELFSAAGNPQELDLRIRSLESRLATEQERMDELTQLLGGDLTLDQARQLAEEGNALYSGIELLRSQIAETILQLDYAEAYLQFEEDQEGRLAYLPEGRYFEHPVYGNGGAGWEKYHRDNESPAQNLSLNLVLGPEYGRFPDENFNLCGQLAVLAMLGYDLKAGMELFHDDMGGILVRDLTTSSDNLYEFSKKLLSYYFTKDFDSRPINLNDPLEPLPEYAQVEQLLANLADGKRLITLMTLNTSTGMLTENGLGGSLAAHWVWVQDIVELSDGTSLVRVYNSYMDREEIYTWEQFSASWATSPGNDFGNQVLRIPPSED